MFFTFILNLMISNYASYNLDEKIIYINNDAEFTGEEIAEFVAMHEVAHITEGTVDYAKMAEVLDKIAKDENAPQAIKDKIGDVKARENEIRKLYKGQMKNMSLKQREFLVDTELRADLVGILLGDEYFIEKLAQRDASLVQKIFNKLKALAKRDTSSTTSGPPSPTGEGYKKSTTIDKGSAKYLNKLVSKFGKAIDKSQGGVKISQLGREDEEKSAEVEDERKSVASLKKSTDEAQITLQDVQIIRTINDGKRKSINDFTSEDIQKAEKWARKFYKELGVKSPFFRAWFGDWRAADKKSTKILEATLIEGKNPRGTFVNKDTGWEIVSSSVGYDETISHSGKDKLSVLAMRNVDRIIENGVLFDTETSEYGRGKKSIHTAFMHKFYSLIKIKEQFCIAKLAVEESYLPGQNKTHKKFYHVRAIKIEPVSSVEIGKSHTSIMENTDSNISISDLFKIVKQHDKNFHPKPVNKAFLNEDGTPRVVYHGSNQEFSVFDLQMSGKNFGETSQGFFFFINKKSAYPNSATDYANEISKKGGTPKVYACYLSIKKPLRLDSKGYYDTVSYFDANHEKIYEQYLNGDYDGVIIENSNKSADDGVLYLVDDSTQIKSATDNIGTFDKDNPDIRYSISKNSKFAPGRHAHMQIAEELVKGYNDGTLTSEDAVRKLNALGYQTGINADNALDMLEGLIPEIRDFATSEREAYRESNRKEIPRQARNDVSEDVTEEEANEQARRNLDYWVNNGDFTQGSVRYVQNGKVKVKLAQTANEAQLVKYINNHMMDKKYPNKDVKNIIDEILADSNIWGYDEYSSYKGKLKGKSLNEVKKLLWAALNTAPEGERIGPALDIADYIVKHGILVEMVDVTEDVWRAREIIEALEPYKHNIDVSHIKGDIEARYDKDRTPYLTWALKKDAKGRGYTADEVGQALEEIGIEVSGDRGKLINEADIFIAIHELYKQAHSTIKQATPHDRAVINAFSGEEAYELKQKIAREILASFDKYGQETTLTKVEKKYRKEIEGLKKRVKDVHEENRLKNAVLYEVQKIKDSKAGKYHNATQVQEQALNALKSLLGRIKYRSDINRSSTRAIMKELAAWYTEDNPVLQNFAVDKKTSETKGLYNSYIKTLIDLFLIENDIYAENKSSVLEMAPAFEATGNEFAKGEVDLVTQVDEYFKTFNNQAYNEEIGNVLIDKRGIKDDIAHGIGRKKAATFVAVPNVIKNGKVVDYQNNWKGRGYDTAVIAAPVTIAGEKHYMGVVVIQNKENNRFYVHEVATIKKEGAQPFKTSLAENNSNAGGDTPSVISILQNLAENNPSSAKIIANSQKNAGKPLDTTELEALNTILHHMNFVFESYGKIWRGGRWVEATDVASEQIAIYKEAQGNKTVVGRLIENGYFNFFMDPELVCARLDGHDKNGYFTTLLEDLRQADIKQRHDEMLALKRYDEFEKKHKRLSQNCDSLNYYSFSTERVTFSPLMSQDFALSAFSP